MFIGSTWVQWFGNVRGAWPPRPLGTLARPLLLLAGAVAIVSNAELPAQAVVEGIVDRAFAAIESGSVQDRSIPLTTRRMLELEYFPESRFPRLMMIFTGTFQERIAAAYLASKLPTEGAEIPPMERYLALLREEEAVFRTGGLLTLVYRTDWSDSVADEVVELLGSAVDAPWALIAILRTGFQHEQLPSAIARGWNSSERPVREAAIVLSGHCRPPVPGARRKLESALAEDRLETRILALYALLNLGTEDGSSLKAILQHAGRCDGMERLLTMEVAGLLHGDDPSLAERMVPDLARPDRRRATLERFARFAQVPAATDPFLLEFLTSEDPKLRKAACLAACSRLGDSSELKDRVVALLADRETRIEAALVLGWTHSGTTSRTVANRLNSIFNDVEREMRRQGDSRAVRELEWDLFCVAAALARLNPKAHKTAEVLVKGLPRRRPPSRPTTNRRNPIWASGVFPLLREMVDSFPLPSELSDIESRVRILALQGLAGLERVPPGAQRALEAMQAEPWPPSVLAEIPRTLEAIRAR